MASRYAVLIQKLEESMELMQDIDIKSTMPNMNRISQSLLNMNTVTEKLKEMEKTEEKANAATAK